MFYAVACEEDDISTNMSQTGSSPNSNSSNLSGRESPSSKALSYSPQINKKHLTNKGYATDDINRRPSKPNDSKKQRNNALNKSDDIKNEVKEESSSENSDYDESNSERDEEKCSTNKMGSRYFMDDEEDEKVCIHICSHLYFILTFITRIAYN